MVIYGHLCLNSKKEKIMKKVYMMPLTKWVEAQTEDMIAGSPLNITGDSGSAEVIDVNATGDGLSRQSLWDEE